MPTTDDPPDGIEVDFFDLSSGGSHVAQSYDAGGQCVKFAPDTRYKIEIINWNNPRIAQITEEIHAHSDRDRRLVPAG